MYLDSKFVMLSNYQRLTSHMRKNCVISKDNYEFYIVEPN